VLGTEVIVQEGLVPQNQHGVAHAAPLLGARRLNPPGGRGPWPLRKIRRATPPSVLKVSPV
jgi:hypothetical protein